MTATPCCSTGGRSHNACNAGKELSKHRARGELMPVALLSVAAHALGGVCIVMALAPLFPGGLRLHDHAGECPESAPVWRRCPKRALRARGGPTGRQAGIHG